MWPNFRPLTAGETRAVLSRYGLEPRSFFSLGRLNRRKKLGNLNRAYAAVRTQAPQDLPLVIGGKVTWQESARRTLTVRREARRHG